MVIGEDGPDGQVIMQLRAAKHTYVVLTSLIMVPLMLSLMGTVIDPQFWEPAALCTGSLLVTWAWLRAFQLSLFGNRLVYRRLLRRAVSVELSRIDRVTFEIGINEYRDRFRPHLRLVIRTKDRQRIDVNAQVFGRREMKQFEEALGVARKRHLPSAAQGGKSPSETD